MDTKRMANNGLTNDLKSGIFEVTSRLREIGSMFQYIEDEPFNGRNITVNGRELLHFGSCSYLGMETHPDLINSSIEAVKKYGTQTPSSRAGLSSALYTHIEELLPEIFPGHHIISQTVTLAHLSVLPLLIQGKDAIIMDSFAHNSIRMASQVCQSKGTFIIPTKHNDINYLEYLIKRLTKEGHRNIWYCADSIYSMHGDYIDIVGLYELLEKYDNFYAYVDDAHGTGWYGKNGRGYVFEHVELHPRMVVIESFAKSVAGSGGLIIVKDKDLADIIRLTGQTMIFSGPIQPSTLAAVLASLKLQLSSLHEEYQKELFDLIRYFNIIAKEKKINTAIENNSPIKLLKVGNVKDTFMVLEKLIKKGYFTLSAVYPAVCEEDSGIRITLTRHLSKKDVENFITTLSETITAI